MDYIIGFIIGTIVGTIFGIVILKYILQKFIRISEKEYSDSFINKGK